MRLSRSALLARLRRYRRGGANLARFAAIVAADLAASAADTWRRALARRRGAAPFAVVGVDASPLHDTLTGVGWYEHHLLAALSAANPSGESARFNLYCRAFAGEREHVRWLGPPLGDAFRRRLHRVPEEILVPHRILAPLLRRIVEPLFVIADGNDVFFAPNYFLPRWLAPLARRRVVTVHDLAYKVFPEYLQAETLANLERDMGPEIAGAEAIVAVSAATARDVERHYPGSGSRLHVVHSGHDPAFAAPPGAPSPVAGPYLLFVSTLEPRKNVAGVVAAFEILRSRFGYRGRLVLAGKPGWKYEPIALRIAGSPASGDIVRLDYVDHALLPALYAGADAVLFPSHYEGFGFPLLEAMASGVPCVAAANSSLPEIGSDAVLYCDSRDSEDIAARAAELLADDGLRARMIERGRRRAGEFRWEDAAQRMRAIFDAAAAS